MDNPERATEPRKQDKINGEGSQLFSDKGRDRTATTATAVHRAGRRQPVELPNEG
jgi:hypothetical protein